MIKQLFSFIALTALLGSMALAQAGFKVGQEVEDFELRNTDGEMVSMSDYPKAKGFIVVFTCNHCPYAKMYEQRIMELAEAFNPKGYQVIAIQPNDPEAYPEDNMENMRARATEMGYDFPYVIDESQATTKAYGATRTPETRVIERTDGGKLVLRYRGAIDDNYRDASEVEQAYTAKAVNALLADKTIETTSAKAVGCSIKWKDS